MPVTTNNAAKVISSAPPSYAVIDLGTNSCRLLIARNNDGALNVVDSFSATVSLGEGLFENNKISKSSIQKTIKCLKKISLKIQKYNIVALKAVATETCRRAKNSKELLQEILVETGIEFEIIDTKKEAELACASCRELHSEGTNIIFDIGGGSTQIIILKSDKIIDYTSVPYGVLTLTDKIGKSSISEAEFNSYFSYIKSYFNSLLSHIDGDINIIGTSGTITTISAVHFKLDFYKRSAIDGKIVNQADIMELAKNIAIKTEVERVEVPIINKKYAKLMLGGCIILYAICDTFKSKKITVVDRGIREGLLKTLMQND